MIPRRDSRPLEYPALLPMFGGMEKKARILDREVVTLGRARGSDFCLDGNEVSALHCILFRASDGYRVRDCGSRTGTRVNGQSTKNATLVNGDVLQIGPFSFEVRIPKSMNFDTPADPLSVEKLKRSRSHLVHLALRMRKRLITVRASGAYGLNASDAAGEKPEDVKGKIKQFETRHNQLEQAEQELLQEKEDLEKLRVEFQRQTRLKDAELVQRREQLEAEFQKKAADASKSSKKKSQSAIDPKAEQQLQSQKAELDRLAKELKTRDEELGAESVELQSEQDRIDRLKAIVQEEQIRWQRELETEKKTIQKLRDELEQEKKAGLELAEEALAEQRAQLAGMIDEVKMLQDELLLQAKSTGGDSVEFTVELETLRQQVAKAEQSLADQTARLRELEAENSGLQAKVKEAGPVVSTNGISRADMEKLRSENASLRQLIGAADQPNDAAVEVREENKLLRQMLDEAEAELRNAKSAPIQGDSNELEQLRGENDLLRTLLHEKEDALSASGDSANVDKLKEQLQVLQESLNEREAQIAELKEGAQIGDTDTYEAELNTFRKELEKDRTRLNKEIDTLRIRNQELDEATREMEMEMSRERAEMARERIRLDRLREELKADMEKMQREHDVRGSLASVHKLRDEIAQRTAGSNIDGKKNVADRLRPVR
jgi:pSer/pThr/pTyr-binding forkhead associated (FHA) protein